MKKAFIIAGIITAVGLALFITVFAVAGSDLSIFGGTVEPKTYPVGGSFTGIEIDSGESDIVFKPSADGKASVVCEERAKVTYGVRVENGTLKIAVEDSRAWYEHLTFFAKRQSMTVYLPDAEYEALRVSSGTGDVSVPAGFTFASAEVTASTGDVSFGASVGGLLKIKTSTGDITLDRLSAGQIALEVSTGDVKASSVGCEGEIAVKVSTGDAVLTDVTCASLQTTGSTGRVTLKNVIAEDSFAIERSTGDVRFEGCDAGSIKVDTSTGDVTGTLLSEKVFLAKASTGDVSVPDTTTGGRCEITTSTGDIGIAIVK